MKQKHKWTYSTWRQYRAAMVYGLRVEVQQPRAFGFDRVDQAIELLYGNPADLVLADADRAWLNSFQFAASVAQRPRTSAAKSKGFSEEVFADVYQLLGGEWAGRTWSSALANWLQAARLVGLRPIEWATAELHEVPGQTAVLVVRNAKATNGRGNGAYRTLLLEGFQEEHLGFVRAHLRQAHIAEAQGMFGQFYKACANLMTKATTHLYPRRKLRPTLYSARHQFLANVKAAGKSAEEVAALAGHGSADTADSHYARASAGEVAPVVLPVAREVESVRAGREWKPGPRGGSSPVSAAASVD